MPWAELSASQLKRKLLSFDLYVVISVRQFVCLCVFDNGVTGDRTVVIGSLSDRPYFTWRSLRQSDYDCVEIDYFHQHLI